MERREFIALLGGAAAAMMSPAMVLSAMASPGRAQASRAARSWAERLSGTWSFVSSENTRRDGSTYDRWGPDPKGILMFDRNGHYSQIIVGSESRVFGAKTFCAFGTYSLDEVKKLLTTHIAGCSVPSLIGAQQTRTILVLNADELKYTNPIVATGATAKVLWKRVA
jgi:hypothetical protein